MRVKANAEGASVASGVAVDEIGGPEQSRAVPWYRVAVNAAVDLLFPPRCVVCFAECEARLGGPMFCATCEAELAVCDRPMCARCGLICSDVDEPMGKCSSCRGLKLLCSQVRTIGAYQGALRDAVLQAKREQRAPLAGALGMRLAEAVVEWPFEELPEVAVPVPMHWWERARRGTNQAVTIAGTVAKGLEMPVVTRALVCTRRLQRQATLNPPERRKNVRGAFRVRRPLLVAGKRVLLVDDVMTTGATAHECSRVLLEAGSVAVFVATVARSGPEQ